MGVSGTEDHHRDEDPVGSGTVGIVLAAGRSERFGPSNKLLAAFRGRPLAAHAAAAMRAAPVGRRIAVISDPNVAALFDGHDLVEAPRGCPQSESLGLGVTRAMELGAERIVVTLADMPFVTPDLIAEVVSRCVAFGASACTDMRRRSPPACFSRHYFGTLLEARGDSGAGGTIRTLPAAALVDADGLLADVDTSEDLAALGGTPRPL